MKRIEARDETGKVMTYWTLEQLDEAKRLVALSAAPWVLGIADFESEAEADAKRLDYIREFEDFEWKEGYTLLESIDKARNAPKPTFTKIESCPT